MTHVAEYVAIRRRYFHTVNYSYTSIYYITYVSAVITVTTIIYYSVTWVSPWGRNVYSQSRMISILWITVINFNCIQQFSFDNYISIFDRIAILYYFSRLVKAPLFGFSFFLMNIKTLLKSNSIFKRKTKRSLEAAVKISRSSAMKHRDLLYY